MEEDKKTGEGDYLWQEGRFLEQERGNWPRRGRNRRKNRIDRNRHRYLFLQAIGSSMYISFC